MSGSVYSEYACAIGRVAMAAGMLEDIVIMTILRFWDKSVDARALHVKLLYRGIAANLKLLRRSLRTRLSQKHFDEIEPLLTRVLELNRTRNEQIHASWAEMVDAQTGEFHSIKRFRYKASKGDIEPTFDVSTPTVEAVNETARQMNEIAELLSNKIERAWDLDERVVLWRRDQSSN